MQDNLPVEGAEDSPRSGLSTADLAGVDSRGDSRSEPRSFGAADASARPDERHEEASPLFPEDKAAHLRHRWTDIQAGFVDEPQRAVQDADRLVAETIQQLAQIFADERAQLEQRWGQGSEVSTEDLRQALQRYRSFFSRLLAV